ncbi:unnamed protein product [Arabidopsis thaliana]|uniref:Uncharacterized protein n=2 Tax=Arabidopsis thaliana TaxID=3702 RepID=A0A654EYE2_ARATH|nr:uncharacterized protein AT1G70175 [Arabidopsis thaliana]ANM58134.1 hypothetical protein AT1G70175 [Arabidopsis thaliana]CAA0327297.1 unnamed protein product [Arabidopsis thaliana]VYS50581.1 unnamed protein product [Arabidopsis thaliana]|eukprot:NP_001320591.1 hypothetical protein AT1G70175 [Arabidopsis thaliana]
MYNTKSNIGIGHKNHKTNPTVDNKRLTIVDLDEPSILQAALKPPVSRWCLVVDGGDVVPLKLGFAPYKYWIPSTSSLVKSTLRFPVVIVGYMMDSSTEECPKPRR